MNKYLIILLIIIFFSLKLKVNIENMKAKTYLNTSVNKVEKKIDNYLKGLENVSNEDVVIKKKITNELTVKPENKKFKLKKELGDRKLIWEEKFYNKEEVVKIIEKILKEAQFDESIIKEVNFITKFINSRNELIKFLPSVNGSEKITYQNIVNLTKMINPTNFINVVESNKNLPVFIKPFNNMIVNNFLYHYTPYGVIKYKFRNKTNKDNNMINGVLEATVLNKINKYNSIYSPIFSFRGKLLQSREGKLYNLETNKIYDLEKALEKSNYFERIDKSQTLIKETKENDKKTKIIEKFSNKDDQKQKKISVSDIIFVLNKGPTSYIVYPEKVEKEDEFSSKINKVIKDNNLKIIGILPKYDFYKKLKYSTIFLCNDNLYFTVTSDVITSVRDFKKDFGFSISKDLPKYMSCQDQKIIFNQMIKQNIIFKSASDKMLKRLKCKV